MTEEKTKLQRILVSDDASRYLADLPLKEKSPQYGQNGLPEEGDAPSKEEQQAVREVWCPPLNK
jgi:hypothetical protein